MIEKIYEKNVWDSLKETTLPIVIYGMGNGADMIIEKLESIGVSFVDVFASDEFVRGHSFHGKTVLKYSQVCEKYDDFVIVMAFAVHDEKMLNRVRELSQEHTLYFPDVPVVGNGIFSREYVQEHNKDFDLAYSLLSDEESRKSFVDVLNFKVSGKPEYLFKCEKKKEEIYSDFLHVGSGEIFMDLGAYDGDTVREFLAASNNKYRKIYAVEADSKNYKKLTASTENINNIETFNLAVWDKKETLFFEKKKGRNSKLSASGKIEILADSVDNILGDREITILKMDIEGSEEKALLGAEKTIRRYRPRLYICAYHRNSDMFVLPQAVHRICPDYRFHFAHHPYVPAWESNFYCDTD